MDLNLISRVSAWSHLVEGFNSTWFFTKLIKSQATKKPCSAASNYSSLCGSGSLPFLLLFVHKRQGSSILDLRSYSLPTSEAKNQGEVPKCLHIGTTESAVPWRDHVDTSGCVAGFSDSGLCLINRLQGWLHLSRWPEVLSWRAFPRAEVWQKGLV